MLQIDNWPATNFTPEEILSPESINLYKMTGLINVDDEALENLQAFRDFIGISLVVNFGEHRHRGTRTYAENQKIKGSATNSPHCLGKAFDISCKEFEPIELYDFALKFKRFKGIGIYDTWLHVDCAWRSKITVWDNRSK